MRVRKSGARRLARRRLFREVKGAYGKRSKLVKMATETLLKARAFAFRDRRDKKRLFRRDVDHALDGCVPGERHYSQFINGLTRANVGLNRKSLSELAIHNPPVFDELVKLAQAELQAPASA